MNISRLLVRTFPEGISPVSARLKKMPGVEVHGNNNDGRIVVTVAQEKSDQLRNMLSQVTTLPGVLAASMIYQHIED